ncbi:MAG: hypothetical protein ACQEQL_06195, partial [Pseudomonadota bacterium]
DYCTLRADFSNGDNLVIARDLSGAMSGAYQVRGDEIPEQAVVQLDVNIDETDYRHYQAKPVQGNTLIFSISHDYDLVDSLMAGRELSLSYNGQNAVYGLKGSADGFRSLNNCLRNLSGRDTLPWESGISGPGPLLAPQFSRQKPRKDAFNDPDSTYIIVHHPETESRKAPPEKADMPKIEAAAVNPVEELSLTEDSSNETSENKEPVAPQSCKIENSQTIKRSLLRNLIAQDIQSRIKLASDAEMNILEDQEIKSINWTAGQVQGHFSLVSLIAGKTGAETASRVLGDLKSACPGSFVVDKNKDYLTMGVQVEEYQAVCSVEDQSALAHISFLSDGFETAILSFEGAVSETGGILGYKSMIMDGLSGHL